MKKQTHWNIFSTNQRSDTKLVTLRVPNYLCNDFDQIVKFKRGTRTSYLVNLMESFVVSEVNKIKETNRINEFISDIQKRNPTTTPLRKSKNSFRRDRDDYEETYYEPLMVPTLDEEVDWQDRLASFEN
jgi:hypothetical protein